jgi:hypothetical protein
MASAIPERKPPDNGSKQLSNIIAINATLIAVGGSPATAAHGYAPTPYMHGILFLDKVSPCNYPWSEAGRLK